MTNARLCRAFCFWDEVQDGCLELHARSCLSQGEMRQCNGRWTCSVVSICDCSRQKRTFRNDRSQVGSQRKVHQVMLTLPALKISEVYLTVSITTNSRAICRPPCKRCSERCSASHFGPQASVIPSRLDPL